MELNPQLIEKGYNELYENCAICQNKLCNMSSNVHENLGRFKCNHVYHIKCIAPWLIGHSTCPMCRENLACVDNDEQSLTRIDIDITKYAQCHFCNNFEKLTSAELWRSNCDHYFHKGCIQSMKLLLNNNLSHRIGLNNNDILKCSCCSTNIYWLFNYSNDKYYVKHICLYCTKFVDKDKDNISTECGHLYHTDCFKQNFNVHNPICLACNETVNSVIVNRKITSHIYCSYCQELENLECNAHQRQMYMTKCGHHFHTKCKQADIYSENQCHICKKKLEFVNN